MRPKVITVTLKESHDVLDIWSKAGLAGEEYEDFLKNMGLKTPGKFLYLYEIVNQKLWMLAKIKYGF